VIAGLARLLNNLPAEPSITLHCPAITASYRIVFVAKRRGQPGIVASPSECLAVAVSVGGHAEPALLGGTGVLGAIDRLLGIRVGLRGGLR